MERWTDVHRERVRVVRLLRRAGYVARHRWQVDGVGRYTEGPARGCRAVDPWRSASQLGTCGAHWRPDLRLRASGDLTLAAWPLYCGARHVCPVCAARISRQRAAALRAVVAAEAQDDGAAPGEAPFAFVTLTQRADAEETLLGALARWRRAWCAMTSGRAGAAWRRIVVSHYYGLEVTRGTAGRHWHVHAHVIIRLAPGVDQATASAAVGAWWQAATAAARPGYGWNPWAGGVRGQTWSGDWWRQLTPERVYQAAKYPCAVVELGPVALAEFLAVAHGRRWHDGGGGWRGIHALAERIEDEAPPTAEGPDIGQSISASGPRCFPPLGLIDPTIGLTDDRPAPWDETLGTRPLAWRLAAGVNVVAVSAAAQRVGGRVAGSLEAGWWCELSAAAARDLLRTWDASYARPPPA